MKNIIYILFSICVLNFGMAQKKIDPINSKITFTATNLGVNVPGKLRKATGTIQFDENDLASSFFKVKIPAKTINTKNSMRDEHLKEEEFFDVQNHPFITFESTEITKAKTGYIAKGKLTIKGTTKIVLIPFEYSNGEFTGSLTINRNDYAIGGDGFLDTIGDEVKISIVCKTLEE